jgi:hypothetical protein
MVVLLSGATCAAAVLVCLFSQCIELKHFAAGAILSDAVCNATVESGSAVAEYKAINDHILRHGAGRLPTALAIGGELATSSHLEAAALVLLNTYNILLVKHAPGASPCDSPVAAARSVYVVGDVDGWCVDLVGDPAVAIRELASKTTHRIRSHAAVYVQPLAEAKHRWWWVAVVVAAAGAVVVLVPVHRICAFCQHAADGTSTPRR